MFNSHANGFENAEKDIELFGLDVAREVAEGLARGNNNDILNWYYIGYTTAINLRLEGQAG